jgi:hypothetical protein
MHAERSDEQSRSKRRQGAGGYYEFGAGASISADGVGGRLTESEGSKAKSTAQEGGEVNEDDSGDGITENGDGTMTVTTSGISLTYESISSSSIKDEVDSYMNRLGLVGTASGLLVSKGIYTQTNGNIGNFLDRPFNQLSTNAKAHYRWSSGIKTAGNLFTGATLAYSFYQSASGEASWGSLVYDGSMVGLSFIPVIGIPLSVTGSVYKEEITNYESDISDRDRALNRLCFVAGTKISMGNGIEKNIEDIKIGDEVMSYDFALDKTEKVKVLKIDSPIHDNLITIKFENGTININTEDHPYYVIGKGWASFNPELTLSNYNGFRVKKLEEEDLCFMLFNNEDLTKVKIVSIKTENMKVKTYNLTEVEKNKNFFANKILVHNKNN